MIRSIFAIAATITALTAAHAASPLRPAVIKYTAANDEVQAAVYIDVCGDDGYDSFKSVKHLNVRDRRSYAQVRSTLERAYGKAEQTDQSLERLNKDFCNAVTPR